MKKLLFTVLMLSSCCAMAQWAQAPITVLDKGRLLVMYDLTFKEDSTHLDYYSKERQMLLLGDEVSSYQGYKQYRLKADIRKAAEEGRLSEWMASGVISEEKYGGRYNFIIFKNHPKGKITVVDHAFLTGTFQYEEDLDAFQWEIMDDTMRIGGYLAQKAVCDFGGRTWEAWFTDELPFNDGPYKFNGLPGLIVKIADTRGHYSFEMVSVEVPESGMDVVWEEEDYLKTTKQGFFKAEDDARANVMENIKGEGISSDVVKTAGALAKCRNNPIELNRK